MHVSVHLLHNKSICGCDLLQLCLYTCVLYCTVHVFAMLHNVTLFNYHRESSQCANNECVTCMCVQFVLLGHNVGGRRGR